MLPVCCTDLNNLSIRHIIQAFLGIFLLLVCLMDDCDKKMPKKVHISKYGRVYKPKMLSNIPGIACS